MADRAASGENSRKTTSWLKRAAPWLVLYAVALGVRLAYLFEIVDHPVLSILLGDAESYDAWAQEIVATGWIGERTFYQAPFYPYFLAVIYTLGARDFILVRVIQAIIGAGACVFLAGAGARFFDRKTGWLAGGLLAIYPPALFFDILIQKAVLGMFFMCMLLFLLSVAARNRHDRLKPGAWVLIGAVLACFALVRENALILTPAIGLWMVVHYWRAGWKPLLSRGLLVVAGLAIIFLPVTLRNYAVGGEFVLTTSQLGPNFYIGNSKEATGFYRPLIWDHSDWKYERSDAQNLAEQALGRKLSPNEISDYWLHKALDDIREQPARWLRLMGKKWLMTWNAVEASDSESIYAHFRFSRLLNALGQGLHLGIILPLAALGVCLSWPRRRELWGILWLWLCFAGSVTLFFVFARYRHPMAAIILLFAAAGLRGAFLAFAEKRHKLLAAGALAALAIAVVANWPILSRIDMEAPTHFNIGYELEQRDQLDAAREYYLRSMELVGSNTLVHNNLGMIAMKQNRPEEALAYFRDAVKAKPDNWDARINLGIVLAQLGRKSEAIEQYKRVVEGEPSYNPALYYNIACYYATHNETNAGLEWLRKAVEHGYDNWELIQTDPDLDSLRDQPGFPHPPGS